MDFGSQGMYHIGLKPEQGAAYALLTGDPGRVEAVASRLEEMRSIIDRMEPLVGADYWPYPTYADILFSV